jgi:hypothetical protein
VVRFHSPGPHGRVGHRQAPSSRKRVGRESGCRSSTLLPSSIKFAPRAEGPGSARKGKLRQKNYTRRRRQLACHPVLKTADPSPGRESDSRRLLHMGLSVPGQRSCHRGRDTRMIPLERNRHPRYSLCRTKSVGRRRGPPNLQGNTADGAGNHGALKRGLQFPGPCSQIGRHLSERVIRA